MRSARRLAAALAATACAGLLVAGPVIPPVGASAPTTIAPASPTATTSLQLPTQGTSLSPVTAPPTTAASINDSRATRLVNRVVFILVALGVAVALLTIWYWRSTRPVPPALDGLDLMSSRRWLKGRPDKRNRMIAEYHTRRGPVPDETIARTAPAGVRVGAAVAAPEAVPVLAGARVEAASNGTSPPAGEPLLVVAQRPGTGESGSLAELVQAREAGDVSPSVNGRPIDAAPVADSQPAGERGAPSPAVEAEALPSAGPEPGEPGVDPAAAEEAPPEPVGPAADADRVGDTPFTVVARRPRGVSPSGEQPAT